MRDNWSRRAWYRCALRSELPFYDHALGEEFRGYMRWTRIVKASSFSIHLGRVAAFPLLWIHDRHRRANIPFCRYWKIFQSFVSPMHATLWTECGYPVIKCHIPLPLVFTTATLRACATCELLVSAWERFPLR